MREDETEKYRIALMTKSGINQSSALIWLN